MRWLLRCAVAHPLNPAFGVAERVRELAPGAPRATHGAPSGHRGENASDAWDCRKLLLILAIDARPRGMLTAAAYVNLRAYRFRIAWTHLGGGVELATPGF